MTLKVSSSKLPSSAVSRTTTISKHPAVPFQTSTKQIHTRTLRARITLDIITPCIAAALGNFNMVLSADELRQLGHQAATANTTPSTQRTASQQQQDPAHYLSHAQQDLLLAALHSQAQAPDSRQATYPHTAGDSGLSSTSDAPAPTMNTGLFMSPQDAALDGFNADYTPDLDYLDGEGYDFDNADLGGDMIGALPNGEGHEKRKSPDEQDDDEDGDSKRQETQGGDKGAKKPGRKPLTSEPTTVSGAAVDRPACHTSH